LAARAFEYKGEVDPVSVVHVWRVLALIVGTSALSIVAGLVLPHDWPVDWAALGLGFGLVAVVLGILGVLALRLRREGAMSTPPPEAAFAIALLFLMALTPVSIGLSGASGIFRNLLFAPVVAVATFGNRRMIVLFTAPTFIAVTFAALVAGVSVEGLAVVVVSSGLVWGGVCAVVHLNHLDTIVDLDHQKCLAELSAVAATATTLDHGFEAMAPILGAFLDAPAIEVRRVDPDAVERGELVTTWSGSGAARSASGAGPGRPAPSPGPALDVVAAAAHKGGVLIGADHVLLAMPSAPDSECALVVIAACTPGHLGARMTFVQRAEEARTVLMTLVRRMELLDRLEARSTTDSLTDLANRRALFDRLVRELAAARRDGRSLTVVMIDVDHFKDFNDAYGHLAGDQVLVRLARLLDGRLRVTDLAARFGGEEFCLVLPRTDAAEADAIVADLHDACRRLESPRPIAFSAGIAEWRPDDAVDTVLGRADRALYEAKAAGRNCSVVASSDRGDQPRGREPGEVPYIDLGLGTEAHPGI
jgi:diguanylate cyclase (GGDEF)-like protein